ncbi:hypothetical protein TWF173_009251 [Orbilia oligospora]|nr:hypothetical protein TWF173_009251 [Orbilia oligospora]
MARLLDLPSELLFLIIDELSPGDNHSLGVTCRRFIHLALPEIHSICQIEFCMYAQTYTHMGDGRLFDKPDYPGFVKFGCYTKELYVNSKPPHRKKRMDHCLVCSGNTPEKGELGIKREIYSRLAAIAARSRRRIPNQLELVVPGFTAVTTVTFRSPQFSSGPDPTLGIQIIQMIIENCRPMKKLSIDLYYNVYGREESSALSNLENKLNDEKRDGTMIPSQSRLTGISIQLNDEKYRINLELTYRILRILCGILQDPAKTAARFAFGFCGSDVEYEDPLPYPEISEVPYGPGLELKMVERVALGMRRPECCQILIPGFFHFDENKVKEITINDMEQSELHTFQGINLIATFSTLETIILSYPAEAWSQWVEMILDAWKEERFRALKELRISICDEPMSDDTIDWLLYYLSSQPNYQVQRINGSSPLCDGPSSLPDYEACACDGDYPDGFLHFVFDSSHSRNWSAFDPSVHPCDVFIYNKHAN